MKEIETRLSLQPTEINKLSKEISVKLEYLFKNPEFFKQVLSIREKFKLPAYGIKKCLGTTDKVDKKTKKDNEKKFLTKMSITYDTPTLKSLKIRIKSRQKEFQKDITKLMKVFELPERFREALSSYIIYNVFPKFDRYLSRCPIIIFEDKGEKRLLIEVFGDTKKQDIIRTWKDIEAMKKKYKIRGEHFFRYRDYYKHKLILSCQPPVDTTGIPISDDNFNNLGYFQKNIYKTRYKKHSKNNSK